MKTALLVCACLALLAVAGLSGVGVWWLWHGAHQAQSTIAAWGTAGERLADVIGTPTGEAKGGTLSLTLAESQRLMREYHRVPGILDRRAGEVTLPAGKATAQIGDAAQELASVASPARQTLQSATQTIEGAQGLYAPAARVLNETSVTVNDYRDIANDLLPDVRAGIETFDVAARGVAEASVAVGKAAPEISEAARANVPAILSDGREVVRNVKRTTSLPMVIAKAVWKFTIGRLF
jgi:hypothetical protein